MTASGTGRTVSRAGTGTEFVGLRCGVCGSEVAAYAFTLEGKLKLIREFDQTHAPCREVALSASREKAS